MEGWNKPTNLIQTTLNYSRKDSKTITRIQKQINNTKADTLNNTCLTARVPVRIRRLLGQLRLRMTRKVARGPFHL